MKNHTKKLARLHGLSLQEWERGKMLSRNLLICHHTLDTREEEPHMHATTLMIGKNDAESQMDCKSMTDKYRDRLKSLS